METKPLLYGLIGFFIGGFIVAVAATTFDKPNNKATQTQRNRTEMSMNQMMSSLKTKTGDEYDKAFIADMIEHHQNAVDMAQLSAANAKHDEIKQLSNAIIAAQKKEIMEMKQWQRDWGYTGSESMPGMSN
jgi:uncharacterized protein (DUF305 family)